MKRNLTIRLAPQIDAILINLYELGYINSKTQLIEIALFEWLVNHNLLKGGTK